MIKKGYKVTDSELRSAIRASTYGSVLYRFESPIRPHQGCGPLTVFKTYEAARKFKTLAAGEAARIFVCYYIPSISNHVWTDPDFPMSIEDLCDSNKVSIIPDSVDLADELILGEEVG